MDVLSQAVEQLRLQRVELVERQLGNDYAPPLESALHVVLEGKAKLSQGAATHDLAVGHLAIIPRPIAHVLAGNARLLCASISFVAPDHPLLGVLPSVIHATPEHLGRSPRAGTYLQHLLTEAASNEQGARALSLRLTEVLLIETMRFFVPPPCVECPIGGWFSGLADPSIRRALAAIHARPAEPWTVDSLAKEAGQSRSAFAAHFASIMREPPMAYLTRWRMFQARSLLRQTELPLEDIAGRVGYGSAAAFSLAFSREHEASPGAYRREHAAQRP
jgi:AraC-like DNA-binding protein